MNQITLLGRLTKDPEMRYTQNGTAVTRFTLAVPRDNNDKTDFIYCLVFGKQAESTAQYCNKGRQLLLTGRLEINVRKNEANGQTESFTSVVANRVEFLAKPKETITGSTTQPDNNTNQEEYQQQRFQPGPAGWQDPNDAELPF